MPTSFHMGFIRRLIVTQGQDILQAGNENGAPIQVAGMMARRTDGFRIGARSAGPD